MVNGTAYLVDAGAGVMRRAAQARRAGIAGFGPGKLGIVFLTHLHSDHTIGLPDVIHTGWIEEREAPLQLFGPPGTKDMARHLTEAWSADIDNRTTNKQPHTELGWKVVATDIKPGVVYRDSNVTVTAITVAHDGWAVAFGYKFVTKDRVIVISGDTRPVDAIIDACNGCDVLVHEVYSAEKLSTRPGPWQLYHPDAHTSGVDLGRLAARAKPKLLVLYHQIYWGASDDDLLAEVRRNFSGPAVSGRDLGIY